MLHHHHHCASAYVSVFLCVSVCVCVCACIYSVCDFCMCVCRCLCVNVQIYIYIYAGILCSLYVCIHACVRAVIQRVRLAGCDGQVISGEQSEEGGPLLVGRWKREGPAEEVSLELLQHASCFPCT